MRYAHAYSNGVNVALNKTATANLNGSDIYNGHSLSGVTHGNLARTDSYAANKATTDNWIMVDLGAD